MQQSYDVQAVKYRHHDEVHITGLDHARVCGRLGMLCNNLESPLNVLDLGCGTGRHFHCLRNVTSLTAVDVSPKMLEQARTPVKGDELDIHDVRFVCGDFYSLDFPRNYFGLIYSLGVFGNGCALNHFLARKFLEALQPGGSFFFDVPDASTLPWSRRLRQRLRGRVYHALPNRWQALWDARSGWLPAFIPTQGEILATLTKAGFVRIDLRSEASHLPGGKGRKFECLAWKPDRANPVHR